MLCGIFILILKWPGCKCMVSLRVVLLLCFVVPVFWQSDSDYFISVSPWQYVGQMKWLVLTIISYLFGIRDKGSIYTFPKPFKCPPSPGMRHTETNSWSKSTSSYYLTWEFSILNAFFSCTGTWERSGTERHTKNC